MDKSLRDKVLADPFCQESIHRMESLIDIGSRRATQRNGQWARVLSGHTPAVIRDALMVRLQESLSVFQDIGQLVGLITDEEQAMLAALNSRINRRWIKHRYDPKRLAEFMTESLNQEHDDNGNG